MQSQHSLKLTFSLQHFLEVNFLHCHIEFIQAWPALSLKPALSFGIGLKRKEIFWVTRITRTVTASGGVRGVPPPALPPPLRDQSPVQIRHTSYMEVTEAGPRTDSPVQGTSTAALPPAGAHRPQIGLAALATKVPHHLPAWTLYGNKPLQTQMPLYDLLIIPPSSLHAHSGSVNQLMFFYSPHCLCR